MIVLMKARDAVKQLVSEGWYLARQKGSHRQFRHPVNPNVVTVSKADGEDLSPGELRSIERKAGWR
jgi:predicted RNA binding protein YcfA (HicA-like mRNA interferase family)